MADNDLSALTPYELGETGEARAVPYLIRHLYRGGPNERRLAASAIGKLARLHRDACAVAAVALLDCLEDPAPQVRQYALNTLGKLTLPPEAATLLVVIRDGDEKPYNREMAADILRRLDSADAAGDQSHAHLAPQGTNQTVSAEAFYYATTPADSTTAPTTITLDILNCFLEASYGEPRRLSELLRTAGLADDAIAALRREHLPAYLSLLTQRLRAWLMQVLEERTADIFIRRFELDGRPTPTFAELGRQYGVSRERVRQLEVKVLKRLRSHRYRVAIERIIADAARETLGLPPVEDVALQPEFTDLERASRPPSSSALVTLARFEAGITPTAIAAERELAEGTIYSHLAACIRAGSAAAARAVTPEMVQAVRDVIEGDDPPVSFIELRRRMPSSLSYGHLLCVVAAHPELLPEGRELTEDEVRQARIAIRATVADLAGKLPRSGVIKLLVGSSSSRVAELRDHPAYGALAGFDTTALWQIIDDLLKAGEIAFDEHSRLIYIGASAPQHITP